MDYSICFSQAHHYYKAQLQASGLSGSLRRQLFLLRCVKEKVTHVCGLYFASKGHTWSLILSSIKSLHRNAALTKVKEKRSSSRTRGRRCSRGKVQGSQVRGLCSLYFSWLSSTIPGQCSEMCPGHVSCMVPHLKSSSGPEYIPRKMKHGVGH